VLKEEVGYQRSLVLLLYNFLDNPTIDHLPSINIDYVMLARLTKRIVLKI